MSKKLLAVILISTISLLLVFLIFLNKTTPEKETAHAFEEPVLPDKKDKVVSNNAELNSPELAKPELIAKSHVNEDSLLNKDSLLHTQNSDVNNEHAEYAQKINEAYDQLDIALGTLNDSVLIENMQLIDCEDFHFRAWSLILNAGLNGLEGLDLSYGNDRFNLYSSYSEETLRSLADNNDVAAQQVLGEKLLNHIETFDEGLHWSKLAIAKDSKSAIFNVSDAYYNVFNNDPNTTREQRQEANEMHRAYKALYVFREGNSAYQLDNPDAYKDKPVAQKYFSILNDILQIRESFGLPEFVNRAVLQPPKELIIKCTELYDEEVQRQEIERGQ